MAIRTKFILLTLSILSCASFASAQGDRTPAPKRSERSDEHGGAAGRSRADPSTPTPSRPEDGGGWVVAAYVGGARTAPSRLSVSQPVLGNELAFEGVRFESRSFDPPLYYGLRGGYFMRRMPVLGIEAEFIHLKVFSNAQQRVRVAGLRGGSPFDRELPLGEIVQQYSISHGVNLLLFNASARYAAGRDADSPKGRLILTGRAGAGPTLPHTESSIEGRRQEQYELGRLAWQLAGGAEFRLWRGLYALGEYKFTRTRQRGEVFSGEAESLLRTHHGVFGLSYSF